MTNANINITDKIEARLAENKSGVKTYASYQMADGKASFFADQFRAAHDEEIPMQYIVVYLPKTKRWTPVFNLSSWAAASGEGFYLGWFAEVGPYFTI